MQPLPEFLKQLGKTELKPGGTYATGALIRKLDLDGHARALVIGPAAGSTALFVSMTTQASTVGLVRDASEDITEGDPTLRRRSTARIGEADKLPFEEGEFDAVMIEATLAEQHPMQRRTVLKEAARVLKPGGKLGLHELCWRQPPTAEHELKLHYVWGGDVNPLVVRGWWDLLEEAGYTGIEHELAVVSYFTPKGMESDEGHETAMNIFHNALSNPGACERFVQVYREFTDNRRYYGVIIARATRP